MSEFAQWFHFRVTGAKMGEAEIELKLTGLNSAYPAAAGRTTTPASRKTGNIGRAPRAALTKPRTRRHADHPTMHPPACRYRLLMPISHLIRWSGTTISWLKLPPAMRRGAACSLDARRSTAARSICSKWAKGEIKVWLYRRASIRVKRRPNGGWKARSNAWTDPADPVAARAAQALPTCISCPIATPTAPARGHLRTNAVGTNLNREWAEPALTNHRKCSPSAIAWTKPASISRWMCMGMRRSRRCSLQALKASPAGPMRVGRSILSLSAHPRPAHARFSDQAGLSQDRRPGKANLGISTNQVAERYGACAMTLEMPYKDLADFPEPEQGWSPERCKLLARDCLAALVEWLDRDTAKDRRKAIHKFGHDQPTRDLWYFTDSSQRENGS